MTYSVSSYINDDYLEITDLEAIIFGRYAWSSELMMAELSHPQSVYFVVRKSDSGRMVGFGGIRFGAGKEPDADIQTLAILGDFRGLGLGKKIFRRLLFEAEKRRVGSVFLEVRADNLAAINLYSSERFKKVGDRPAYYQPDAVDAILMRRVLGGPKMERGSKGV